jgi:Mrp family chromosome partitioning ATPase
MEELIAQLTKQFDLVILDTAPVLPVAESRAVSAMADSALLVVRWRKTTIPAAQMALRHLERAGARVGGALLSLVDLRRQARSGLDDEAYYYASYKKYYA